MVRAQECFLENQINENLYLHTSHMSVYLLIIRNGKTSAINQSNTSIQPVYDNNNPFNPLLNNTYVQTIFRSMMFSIGYQSPTPNHFPHYIDDVNCHIPFVRTMHNMCIVMIKECFVYNQNPFHAECTIQRLKKRNENENFNNDISLRKSSF